MAVTAGHGNPHWTRDEVLLALDLYFRCGGNVPGPTDPRVMELSRVIRSLPIHNAANKNETFRNPDGVAFKLQNLRQVATGQGLGNVSTTDKAMWADFGDKPEEVHRLAELIKAETGEDLPTPSGDEVFREGRIVTAMHLRRERKPALRKKLLAVKKKQGKIACDACGDGPKLHSESLEDAAFEVHHRKPLAVEKRETETRLQDVALLCASCHRVIHRMMSLERRWLDVPELSAKINASKERPGG